MALNPTYTPKDVEEGIERRWEASGFFNPDCLPDAKKRRGKPFSIVMPPPNATGVLHLGHATILALEDIMVRYHRMKGDDTLWIPGTDHAAIATQNVVEKELWKTEKKTRHDLGRDEFLKRVEAFVAQSKNTIRKQIRTMGASCDWSREAYTMDAARSAAVNAIFKGMYDDGLIYRGNRIVNWCPRCQSTLADDEVEYKEETTPFYYFKYGPVVIGTARPETKFLDKTIVVHPKDTRYTKLVGKEFEVAWIDGTLHSHVIADPVIDREFGSGAMTITPAHSFEDFEIAQRHGLPVNQIIDENGNFTAAAGSFAGKNARASRAEIVAILQSKGLVDHIDENYVHNLSVCYRCDTPIEPLPKLQWFVNVNKKFRGGKSLKDLAIAAVKSKKITIVPDRFEAVYFNWMNNLRDWCISRQIWFGHRIPVWTRNGETAVGTKPDGNDWEQDPDTLDTWFSSGSWTFSTLGWPDDGMKNKELGITERPQGDLKRFHPTSVLETGYDIIFFWVARMILMTEYALKTIPFKTVYLHGLVRDAQGRKMSKSLGNGIDPLVVAEKFGTDAVRLSLVVGTTPGNDLKLSEQKIEGYRNFVNKLWNIARYVASTPSLPKSYQLKATSLSIADQWILSRLQSVINDVTTHIEEFRFSQAAETLRHFTWDDFADWYIEISKLEIRNPKSEAVAVLGYVLAILLKLWHPFTPFVTEAIWHELRGRIVATEPDLLLIAEWPKAQKKWIDTKKEKRFVDLQSIVREIRSVRADFRISPAATIALSLAVPDAISSHAPLIEYLTKTNIVGQHTGSGLLTLYSAVPKTHIQLDLSEYIDVAKERARLEKALADTDRYINQLTGQLTNTEFVNNAPREIVAEKQEELHKQTDRRKNLETQFSSLS